MYDTKYSCKTSEVSITLNNFKYKTNVFIKLKLYYILPVYICAISEMI